MFRTRQNPLLGVKSFDPSIEAPAEGSLAYVYEARGGNEYHQASNVRGAAKTIPAQWQFNFRVPDPTLVMTDVVLEIPMKLTTRGYIATQDAIGPLKMIQSEDVAANPNIAYSACPTELFSSVQFTLNGRTYTHRSSEYDSLLDAISRTKAFDQVQDSGSMLPIAYHKVGQTGGYQHDYFNSDLDRNSGFVQRRRMFEAEGLSNDGTVWQGVYRMRLTCGPLQAYALKQGYNAHLVFARDINMLLNLSDMQSRIDRDFATQRATPLNRYRFDKLFNFSTELNQSDPRFPEVQTSQASFSYFDVELQEKPRLVIRYTKQPQLSAGSYRLNTLDFQHWYSPQFQLTPVDFARGAARTFNVTQNPVQASIGDIRLTEIPNVIAVFCTQEQQTRSLLCGGNATYLPIKNVEIRSNDVPFSVDRKMSRRLLYELYRSNSSRPLGFPQWLDHKHVCLFSTADFGRQQNNFQESQAIIGTLAVNATCELNRTTAAMISNLSGFPAQLAGHGNMLAVDVTRRNNMYPPNTGPTLYNATLAANRAIGRLRGLVTTSAQPALSSNGNNSTAVNSIVIEGVTRLQYREYDHTLRTAVLQQANVSGDLLNAAVFLGGVDVSQAYINQHPQRLFAARSVHTVTTGGTHTVRVQPPIRANPNFQQGGNAQQGDQYELGHPVDMFRRGMALGVGALAVGSTVDMRTSFDVQAGMLYRVRLAVPVDRGNHAGHNQGIQPWRGGTDYYLKAMLNTIKSTSRFYEGQNLGDGGGLGAANANGEIARFKVCYKQIPARTAGLFQNSGRDYSTFFDFIPQTGMLSITPDLSNVLVDRSFATRITKDTLVLITNVCDPNSAKYPALIGERESGFGDANDIRNADGASRFPVRRWLSTPSVTAGNQYEWAMQVCELPSVTDQDKFRLHVVGIYNNHSTVLSAEGGVPPISKNTRQVQGAQSGLLQASVPMTQPF